MDFANSRSHQLGRTSIYPSKPQVMSKIKCAETLVITLPYRHAWLDCRKEIASLAVD